jgi:hypothetical protein
VEADVPVLFYDADCGPCTLLARSLKALGRGRLGIAGLGSEAADDRLGDLDAESRFGSMHLSSGSMRWSSSGAVLPLIGVVFGRSARAGLDAIPPAAAALIWLHVRMMRAKRAARCGVDGRTQR